MDDLVKRAGYERLWRWFGLSRASWLTLPRVLLHEMPDEWQDRMAALLEEMSDTFPSWGCEGVEFYVSSRKNQKFAELPEYLCNYRHPHRAEIEALKRKPSHE